jgi:hypothetical protein
MRPPWMIFALLLALDGTAQGRVVIDMPAPPRASPDDLGANALARYSSARIAPRYTRGSGWWRHRCGYGYGYGFWSWRSRPLVLGATIRSPSR